MIRPILALLIAVSILLFVWQYAEFTERIRPQPALIVENSAEGRYDVKVKSTCDCEGNAFGQSAVKIQFRGNVLIERTDRVAAGEMIVVEDVNDIKQGLNDFHVQVTPVQNENAAGASNAFSLEAPAVTASNKAGVANAVRVEILHNGYVIASQMVWADSDEPFGELIKIEVNKQGHDH